MSRFDQNAHLDFHAVGIVAQCIDPIPWTNTRLVHMPDYAWICHSCKASNRPGLENCSACGFPAVATGAEIEEAITGIPSQPVLSRKELIKQRHAEMAALALWKKPIAYLFRGIAFVGGIVFAWGILDLRGADVLLGLAVMFVAEALFQLLKGHSRESRIPN